MKTAAIIGGGAFGTAMACAARRAGLEVRLWAREPEVVASINAGRGNPWFLADTPLEPGIAATSHPAEAIETADLVLLAVPSQFLRGIAQELHEYRDPAHPWCPAPRVSSAAPAP